MKKFLMVILSMLLVAHMVPFAVLAEERIPEQTLEETEIASVGDGTEAGNQMKLPSTDTVPESDDEDIFPVDDERTQDLPQPEINEKKTLDQNCSLTENDGNDAQDESVMETPVRVADSTYFTYTVSDGNATITGYYGTETELVIPEMIDGYPVTSIGNSAFYTDRGLTMVTIPESVTSIGKRAFSGCSGLTTVYYNAVEVQDITYDSEVFSGAGSSTGLSVVFGETVNRIPMYLFYNCSGLTTVTIGSNVTSIGNRAFYYCSGLTTVTIGNGVTSIEEYAFSDCSSLTTVTIPESVTSIGDWAFYGCRSLTTVTIPESVTKIGDDVFSQCSGLVEITIPESVTSIGIRAFSGCSSLTMVTIPESVTSIGGYAFYYCSGLTTVTIGNGVTSIGCSAFSRCSGLTTVTIPESVTSIEEYAFSDCSGLTTVTIGSNVTSIEKRAFYRCNGLTTVYYNAVEVQDLAYESYVFSGAGSSTGLSVVFGETVNRIPAYLFYYCNSLTTVTIGSNVTSIGSYAFYYCSGLTTVTIPESVTSIGKRAFSGCSGLTTVYYNAVEVQDLNSESYVFSGAGSSTGLSVVFGETVNRIPACLFYNCSGLTTVYYNAVEVQDLTSESKVFSGAGSSIGLSVVFGETVNRIPAYLFNNCNSLTTVTIGSRVTNIGESVFRYCKGLKEITVNEHSRYYKSLDGVVYTKSGKEVVLCPEGKSGGVSIPDTVKTIGEKAFYNCVSLTEITIPDSVTEIGNYAFYSCSMLQSISIPEDVYIIGDRAFAYCTGLTKIYYNAINARDLSGSFTEDLFTKAGADGEGIRIVFGSKAKYIPKYFFAEKIVESADSPNITELYFTSKKPVFGSNYVFSPGTKCVGYYPYGDDSWEEKPSISSASVIWVAYSLGDPESIDIGTLPDKLFYSRDETIDLTGLTYSVLFSDGCVEEHTIEELELVSYDFSKLGQRTVTIGYRGITTEFTVTVSEFQTLKADSSTYPESSHPYEDDLDRTYEFSYPGAASLTVTFSAETFTENNVDYLYLYDKNGTLIGTYTGAEAAGLTVEMLGDGFSIRLVSDDSYGEYGFAIDSIMASIPVDHCLGDHLWETEAHYTWADDNSTATAYRECQFCSEKDSETVETTVITTATCTEAGTATYSAVFANPVFAAQSRTVEAPATGHTYGAPTWNWSNDYLSATASFACASGDDTQTVPATVTSAPGTGSDVGMTIYTATATFGGQTYTDVRKAVTVYTVTFVDPLDNSVVSTQYIEHGNQIDYPEIPTREDWEFYGWSADSTEYSAYPLSAPVTADATIYGVWSRTVRIKKDNLDDDGAGNGIVYLNGDRILRSTSSAGYYDWTIFNFQQETSITITAETNTQWDVFRGWAVLTDESSRPTAQTELYSTIEELTYDLGTVNSKRSYLWAVFATGRYDVTLVDSVTGQIYTVSMTYGEQVDWDVEWTHKAGYTFDGWYDDPDFTIGQTSVEGPATRYAKFTLIEYSISYDLAGGALTEGQSNPTTYTVESASFTLNNPAKDGHAFTGWTGTGLGEPTKEVTVVKGSTGTRTYTANWRVAHVHDGIEFIAWNSSNSLPTEAGSYYLTQNVTLTGTWTVPSGTVDLCLNGKTISLAAGKTGSVIRVYDTALNLYDCGAGGKITGGKASGNGPDGNGAGVWINSNGRFTMYGGTITGNTASDSGGGVYIEGRPGSFTMNGGTISNNTAAYGGGVYSEGDLIITGGSITGNNAYGRGGGVYYQTGILKASGSPRITGNTVAETGRESNLYLQQNRTITISGSLTDGAAIGVDTETVPDCTSPVVFTRGLGSNGTAGSFSSDWGYEITLASSGEAQLTGGHRFGTPQYSWAEDNSEVTATRVCMNDASHVETETARSTSEVTKPATSTEEGELTYTAEFENPVFETQIKKVAIPVANTTYTLRYDANGGNGAPADQTITNNSGSAVFTISQTVPSRAHYRFLGWGTSADASEPVNGTSVTVTYPDTEKTLYAVWKINSYALTIHYMYADGTMAAEDYTAQIDYGTAYSVASPEVAGYTAEPAAVSGTMGDTAVEVTVRYTAVEYHITYELDGGTNAAANPSVYTIETPTIILQNAMKTGYAFGGWYSDTAFTKKVERIRTGSTGDLTLYAKWTANTFTVDDLTGTYVYTGIAHTPAVTVKDGGTTLVKDTDYAVTYMNNVNAGTATVTVTGIGNYGAHGAVTKTFTIRKAQLTVTAKDKTIVYGDAPANSGVIYSGFVNSETESALTGSLTYTYTYTRYGNVGTYKITAGGLNSDNYEITFGEGTLTVEQKTVGLTWDRTEFTYDGSTHAPAATATGLVNNDTVNVTVTGAQTNAGSYTARATTLSNANYKLPAETSVDYVIAKASQSAPVVGHTDETVSGKKDGTITGLTTAMQYSTDGETWVTITSGILKNLAPGTYYVRFAETGNYNASPAAEVVIAASTAKLTVTFDVNGGSEVAAQKLDYSGKVTKPEDPTKTGYSFRGWFGDEEFASAYDFNAPVTADITVYAKWEINQYTITFDTAGGSEIATVTQDYGTPVTAPADPTREGYTFDGWDKAVPETMPAQNVTITARWKAIEYTISYNANGGKLPEGSVTKYTIEDTVTLPTPTRESYGFEGWYEKADLSGTAVTTIAKGSTGNRTFYAKWKAGAYTITYILDGGTNANANPTSYTVETETIVLADASKTGYTFAGWYSDAGFVTKVTEIPKGSDGDITLYAKFIINRYTITWFIGGVSSEETYEYGAVPTHADPVKEADEQFVYSFTGWEPTVVAVTEDATYTATFSSVPRTYGEPVWTWTSDSEGGYTAAVSFTTNDGAHEFTKTVTATVTSSTTAATCETEGKTVYTATAVFEGKNYEDTKEVTIPASGHRWGTPVWTWSKDYSEATVTYTCANDNSHVYTDDAAVSSVRVEPTPEEDGSITYTATAKDPDGKDVTDTKVTILPATGYSYADPVYTWTEIKDESGAVTGYQVEAVKACNEDESRSIREIATAVFSVKTPATCTEAGESVWKATFENTAFTAQTKTEVIAATGHRYELTGWSWSEDHSSAAAEFTCANDVHHTKSVNAAVTSETTAPTCETSGKTTYTATAEFEDKVYTDTKEEEIPAPGHKWGEPVWTWSEDYASATATFVCANDDSHREIVEAAVTGPENGKYTATVIGPDGKEYTDTVEAFEPVPAFKSQSLVLSGQIGLNFFLELPEISGVDYSKSYMTFKIGKDPTEYRDDFDPNHMNSGKTRYGFTCYVNSIQMADTIKAVFHYGNGKTVSKDYSVAQYIDFFEKNIGSFNAKTITLIRAIADFGHYEQIYLADVNHWTIGDKYAEMATHYTDTFNYSSILSAVNDKAFVKSLGSSNVEKATYKLHLDSETTVDVFLTPKSGKTLTASATFNGKTYKAVKQSDGRYLVQIPNISAHQLGEMITVTGTAGTAFTVKVSALSYTRSILNNASSNTAAKDGLSALYHYYTAVLAYRK